MGAITWIPAVISIIIEIIKLIKELRKNGESVSSCVVAMKNARTKGDMTALERILDKLKSGNTNCN